MSELEYEIIVLLKTINDETREITKIESIEKKYGNLYTISYFVKESTNETYFRATYSKWQIEGMPLWAILYYEKFAKAKLTKPIYNLIEYHIYYNYIYKWAVYRQNGYSWKEILLNYADRKENKWRQQATHQLLKRIGGVR